MVGCREMGGAVAVELEGLNRPGLEEGVLGAVLEV